MLIPRRNILKFVQKHFPDTRLTTSEAQTNCIFHNDTHRHMYVNLDFGAYHCFSCGAKGGFFDLVKLLSPKQQFQKVQYTEEAFSDLLKTPSIEIKLPADIQYFYVMSRYAKPAFNYLISRGLSESDIYYYRMGYCSMGQYAGRIIVPVLDKDDNPVAFVARDYTGVLSPKVLTPPAPKGTSGVKDYIFNYHRAKATKKLLIGEGVFDAIALGVSGIALFGKAATTKQLALIHHAKPYEIIICLDPDAEKEAQQLANTLSGFQNSNKPIIKIAKFPVGEDPSSIGKERSRLVVAEAVEYKQEFSFNVDL